MTITRRAVTVLLTGFALTITALITGAAAGFGMPAPPDPVSVVAPAAPPATTVSYGSPIWVFVVVVVVVVAAITIALTMAVTLSAQRLHARHLRPATP